MGALAQLSTTTLDVEPGRPASMAFTVRNTGSVVDRFSFAVVGGAAQWVTFAPDTLSLFPEASGTVNVLFAAPREPTVTAGPMPFGIRVVSSEDPAGSVVEEGTLNVAAYSDLSVELVPRIPRGRRMARAQMAVDNRSNCPYRAELEGSDPAAGLAVQFSPIAIDVPPGGASFVKLRIRPRQTFWRGPTTTKPFRITLKDRPGPTIAPVPAADDGDATASDVGAVVSPHPAELSADGSMLQESLLPSWFFKALVALIALLALLALLWFLFLRPQIRSTAKDEVNKQLASQGLLATSPTTVPGGGNGSGGNGNGTGGGSVTTIPSTSSGSSSVTSAGLTVNGTSQASGNGTKTVFVVPSGRLLQVTDLLVENAAGDSGTIAVARNGTTLMVWSLANFRDLDYHWIAPTVFASGSKMQMVVSGCTNACTPGIYYAGNLVKTG